MPALEPPAAGHAPTIPPHGRPVAAAVAVLIVATLSFGLGSFPLMDPDEGRNAEVSREMAATGDWAVPQINGLPYLDKPVLYFAVAALAIRAFGATATAARLPALAFALASAALTWWAARRFWGHPAAEIAALVASSSPLAVGFSRAVIFDSALTFFVSLATLCFLLALEKDAWPEGRRWAALAWVAMGFGVLTKGPVALVLPLLVAVPFAVWRRRARRLFPLAGPLLMLVVVVPWLVAMTARVPGFLRYALVTETMARVATGALNRTAPFWYFLPVLLGGAFPWVLAVPGALRSQAPRGWTAARRDPRAVFLILWLVLPLLFFSLSQSKRAHYVLPLVMPIALLVASGCAATGRLVLGRTLAVVEGVVGALLVAVASLPAVVERVDPGIRAAVPGGARAVGLSLVAAGLLALALVRWRPRAPLAVCAVLAVPLLAMPTIGHELVLAIAEARSSRAIVASLPGPPERFRLFSVGAYSPSLSFYMRQDTVMYTDDGEPLRSNYWFRNFSPAVYERTAQMRPLARWPADLATCPAGAVFVARSDRPDYREALAAKLPELSVNVRVAAYGPCPAPASGGS